MVRIYNNFTNELIAECNNLIWNHMYLDGRLIPWNEHHRDLIRMFMGGAITALTQSHDPTKARELMCFMGDMCHPNWLPDNRFFPKEK